MPNAGPTSNPGHVLLDRAVDEGYGADGFSRLVTLLKQDQVPTQA